MPTSASSARDLRSIITETVPVLPPNDERDTQPTLGFQRVLQRAVYHVQSSGRKEVTGANVLVAIFGEKDSHAVYFLGQQEVSRLDVVNYISHGIAKIGQDPASSRSGGDAGREAEGGEEPRGNPLTEFASNLNELAKQGKIDPLIGRDEEVERTIQVLCRRRKNNPLYVGEAGVGKTALAEGLAKRIVEGNVPGRAEGLHDLGARPRRAGRRHQVPRRFREAPQGRHRASSRKSRARSSSSTRSTPSSAPAPRPAARWTRRT